MKRRVSSDIGSILFGHHTEADVNRSHRHTCQSKLTSH